MRYSVGSGLGPKCRFRSIRTCCDMAAAMLWPTPATTRGHCKLGWGTRTFNTRCATPSCRRIGSRTSGVDRRRSQPQHAVAKAADVERYADYGFVRCDGHHRTVDFRLRKIGARQHRETKKAPGVPGLSRVPCLEGQ